MPATMPMMSAPTGDTNPLAGVMATSPATSPEANPRAVGLPRCSHSMTVHPRPAVAAAIWVTVNALTACPLANRADPPLNPNQPNHSRPAPSSVRIMLFGWKVCFPYPTRFRSSSTAASPLAPAAMWTTVPPAKSIAPFLPSMPAAGAIFFCRSASGTSTFCESRYVQSNDHTQWAMGSYTSVVHRRAKMQ